MLLPVLNWLNLTQCVYFNFEISKPREFLSKVSLWNVSLQMVPTKMWGWDSSHLKGPIGPVSRAGSVYWDDCSARYYTRWASPPAAKFRSNLIPRVFSLFKMAAAREKTLAHSRSRVSNEDGDVFKMAATAKRVRRTGYEMLRWR